MPQSRTAKIILLLGVIAGCAWLAYLVDDGLDIGWPQNVVRNWQQFGLFNLRGKMVINPGGYEVLTHPESYPGMSPVSLYPAFFLTKVFSWTGLGTLSFHIALAAAVFWGVWHLLGRNAFAFCAAGVLLLCPGFVRWQKILDPNDISVLIGLPYLAAVVSILKRTHRGMLSNIGLFALTLAFAAINWTTAWVFALGAVLLLGLPQIQLRVVVPFLLLAGVCCGIVVVGSVLVKSGGGPPGAGHAGFLQFLGGYTWGGYGYGVDMTAVKAFLRLAVVNGIGLLPLLILAVLQAKRFRQAGWMSLTPFIAALAEVAFMRNYFGHHPWMAAPVIAMGLVFSLALARSMPVEKGDSATARSYVLPAIFIGCLIYGLVVTMFFRANERNQLMLVDLIRHHTDRSDYIVIVKELDPSTAAQAPRFDEIFDRRVGLADDLNHLPKATGRVLVLSSVPLAGPLSLLAENVVHAGASGSILERTANWFNRTIARRRPGDRMELAESYYLYEPRP